MSGRNFLKTLSVILLGGIAGYTSVKLSSQSSEKNRHIASVPIAKLGKEQASRFLFEVKVKTGEVSKKDNEVSVISVTITAIKDVKDGLTYSWNLPAETNLIEGALNGNIGALSIGESKSFELKVNGFSKEYKRYLSFEVNGKQDFYDIKREVLISSRIEDSLEYLIQQNALNKPQDSMQKLNKASAKKKFSPENVVR